MKKTLFSCLFFATCITTAFAQTTIGCSGSQYSIGGSGYDRAYDVAATTNNEYYVVGVTRSFSANDDLLITRVTTAGTVIWAKKIGNAGAESIRKITPTADGGVLITGQTKSFSNPNGDMLCMKLSSAGNIVWSKIFGLGSSNGDLGMDIIETTDGGYAVSGIINVVGFFADGVVIKLDNSANVVWAKRYNRGDGEDGVGILQKADTLVVAADLQNSGSHYEFMLMKLKLADGSFIMSKKFTPTAHGLFNPYIFKNPAQPGYLISGHTIDFDVYTNMNHTVIAVDDNFNVLHTALVSVNPMTNDFFTGFVPLADGSWIGCATPQTNADACVYRIGSDNSVYYSKKINASTDRRFYRLAVSNDKAMAVGGAVTSGQEDFYLNSFNISGLSDSSCNVENLPITILQPTYSVNNFTWPTFTNVSFPNITSTLTATTVSAPKTNLCPTCIDTAVVINSYTPALAYNSCLNNLTVQDAAAFNVGDTVLLIQMKGAVIDSTNTSNFGTITNYNNAGNYEFNYVKNKTGNVIELKDSLTRQYDFPNGKVQLVRVPYYQTATLNSTLTCLPWDGTRGGILVLNVQDSIVLNANIDVSAKGFKGGPGYNAQTTTLDCFQNNYNYPITSNGSAGQKGESITTISQNIICGKGSPAGGGGGGLGHNSGGGGGSNGGGGGLGGYQLEPCGNAPYDNRGIGGHVLSYSAATNKIFLGSGGGAGQADNAGNLPPTGGNGGGIVIVMANSLKANSYRIITNGENGIACSIPPSSDCHDGMGGGGAGGSVLLKVNQFSDNLIVENKGGKGADMTGSVPLGGRIGAGGGGGGGLLFLKSTTLPANLTNLNSGGANGVLTTDANNPWGATPGQNGTTLFNLLIPIDSGIFRKNIDSVRIKDSSTGCNSFDFKGLAYTNRFPIGDWQWYFGDGGTANTQNTSHSYGVAGTYTVKLVVTDINGCKDSTTKDVTVLAASNYDFNYQVNVCNPLTVQFNGLGTTTQNPYWSFGDGGINTGSLNPVHSFSSQGSYTIKYTVLNACPDTISKTINLSIIPADIIFTHDTTICYGTTKQLLTAPSLSFCWNPTTYLNNPNAPNPTTSTPQSITYYFTAEVEGTNLVTNGNFSLGNTGFTSSYLYSPSSGLNPGVYNVGSNILAWHPGMANCNDHTTGSGNMMMVNGANTAGVVVWSETITVTPNTNYAFSAWLQHITSVNPAQLQFAINGVNIGPVFQANSVSCIWERFFNSWNSGNNTTASISIINQNTQFSGNDFALDDISFAPVLIKRDSVVITIDRPVVTTNPDTTFCQGLQLQLNSAGANSYSWAPPAGLSNPNISNPVASPANTTQYVVTGTTANGCSAKDSVLITIIPSPVITKSSDTIICKTTSVQLFASGGTTYSWSPTATLNNPNIANPIAAPLANTVYKVMVGNANNCTTADSIRVDVHPDPVFAVSSPGSICRNDSLQLNASGGNIYNWQPASDISNPNISNPKVFPRNTATYTVQITETTCNNSSILSTTVTVFDLPNVKAFKSNDIDCTTDFSQLNATGGVNYLWSPATSLNNANISNPIARPAVQTLYTVKGTDINNCINYDTVTVDITVFNKGSYLMPSGFTPNNDGLNDCYGIKYWGVIDELDFSIYNRWGERVFHTKKPGDCWDGTYKGVKQDGNVFVYLIKAKTNCGDVTRKGTFVLIR